MIVYKIFFIINNKFNNYYIISSINKNKLLIKKIKMIL